MPDAPARHEQREPGHLAIGPVTNSLLGDRYPPDSMPTANAGLIIRYQVGVPNGGHNRAVYFRELPARRPALGENGCATCARIFDLKSRASASTPTTVPLCASKA
jgi:hypothetical protein